MIFHEIVFYCGTTVVKGSVVLSEGDQVFQYTPLELMVHVELLAQGIVIYRQSDVSLGRPGDAETVIPSGTGLSGEKSESGFIHPHCVYSASTGGCSGKLLAFRLLYPVRTESGDSASGSRSSV